MSGDIFKFQSLNKKTLSEFPIILLRNLDIDLTNTGYIVLVDDV